MKIKFIRTIELELVDEQDWVEGSNETFTKGQVETVEIIDEYDNSVDLEFKGGMLSYAVPMNCFEIVKGK